MTLIMETLKLILAIKMCEGVRNKRAGRSKVSQLARTLCLTGQALNRPEETSQSNRIIKIELFQNKGKTF